ncbi:MAG: hypothetical protein LBH42_08210, partial [Treponema sp.]|nr:hypothetical protein [Treponema sp.]
MQPNYIIAIDQGGTKTDIIIADNTGNIIGTGNDQDLMVSNEISQNPAPYKKDRRVARMKRIRFAAEKALLDAEIKLQDIQSVSACCTGADWEFEYDIGRKNLRDTLEIEQVSLYNECIGALRGGTEIKSRDCAVLCLGTGANCAVLNREGQEHIYAYYLKDAHQGAYAIGKFIFEAVFDAESGLGQKTVLTKLLLEKTGHKSVDELYMHITTGRTEAEIPWKPVYQDYSPLLFLAISKRDTVAKNYLKWLCAELARYIIITARRFKMQDRDITMVLSGGVPKGGSLMTELLEQRLKKDLPGIQCLHARFEPVVGALLLEYDRIYPDRIP